MILLCSIYVQSLTRMPIFSKLKSHWAFGGHRRPTDRWMVPKLTEQNFSNWKKFSALCFRENSKKTFERGVIWPPVSLRKVNSDMWFMELFEAHLACGVVLDSFEIRWKNAEFKRNDETNHWKNVKTYRGRKVWCDALTASWRADQLILIKNLFVSKMKKIEETWRNSNISGKSSFL